MRGTVVGVGCLDRSKEEVFKAAVKMDGIQSLNNFQFEEDGSILAQRQYNIGTGKVRISCYSQYAICTILRFSKLRP